MTILTHPMRAISLAPRMIRSLDGVGWDELAEAFTEALLSV
jgi:hypothetical protein